MKKLTLALLTLTIIGVSCSKKQETVTLPTAKASAKKTRLAYADRKLKTFTITDEETGQSTTMYDCTEAGSSCDVGNPAPKPTGGSGIIISPANTGRLEVINSISDHSHLGLKNLFILNNYQVEFPFIYSSSVYNNIVNDTYKLSFHDDYLIIKNELGTPIFVYNMNPFYTDEFLMQVADNSDLRVAKLNTETGKMECIDPGKNCSVKAGPAPKIVVSELYRISNFAFPDNALQNHISDESYNIISNSDFYVYKPANANNETFYLKK